MPLNTYRRYQCRVGSHEARCLGRKGVNVCQTWSAIGRLALGGAIVASALIGCPLNGGPLGPPEPGNPPSIPPPSAQPGSATATVGPLKIPSTNSSTRIIDFDGNYKDWGTLFADAACSRETYTFDGRGFAGARHVAIWLQGASQNFFPGQLENGRVPGAVLLGESDVLNDHITFQRTLGPAIGPTEDGGSMPLVAGASYGWVVVTDGASASYSRIEMPAKPCLALDPLPKLNVSGVVCAGSAVTFTGEGFAPGPVILQLWEPYQPAPGEFDSGKSPPRESQLGKLQADATGHFAFAWTATVVPGGKYLLRVLDRGRTRLTTMDLKVCGPSPTTSPRPMAGGS
jgi:hypothetical protein